MIIIEVSNHKSKLHDITVKQLTRMVEDFKIPAVGYFYSPAWRNRTWDGKVKYISDKGYFTTGLLAGVVDYLEEKKWKYGVVDNREELKILGIPRKLANGFVPRDYQREGVVSTLDNMVAGIPFQRGVIAQATNAGKNLYAALLFQSFSKSATGIFIVNRQHIFDQAVEEIGDLLGEDIGYIGKPGIKHERFMVCMVQSLNAKLARIKETLLQFDVVIADECHYGAAKQYNNILNKLHYATVRIGMSGTPFLHKDKNKNQKIRGYFGDILSEITNKELVDQGHSTPPKIYVWPGNTTVKIKGDHKEEETKGLIFNKERNKMIRKRVRRHVIKDRLPLMVICKYHNHTEYIYKMLKKRYPELRVSYIHVNVSDRAKRLRMFKDGHIDILVSSLLIKEGKNLPLIKALVYAAGGDSMITILQVFGRLLRKHKSKKVVYFDDFYDIGSYLLRHSKHRLKQLKNEGFKVHEKYKEKKEK